MHERAAEVRFFMKTELAKLKAYQGTSKGIRCPTCGENTCTIDSRRSTDDTQIRRRRIRTNEHRFTTVEAIHEPRATAAEIVSGIWQPPIGERSRI